MITYFETTNPYRAGFRSIEMMYDDDISFFQSFQNELKNTEFVCDIIENSTDEHLNGAYCYQFELSPNIQHVMEKNDVFNAFNYKNGGDIVGCTVTTYDKTVRFYVLNDTIIHYDVNHYNEHTVLYYIFSDDTLHTTCYGMHHWKRFTIKIMDYITDHGLTGEYVDYIDRNHLIGIRARKIDGRIEFRTLTVMKEFLDDERLLKRINDTYDDLVIL